ncbi:hypothetical protein [Salipiger mucosus]|uniref:Uncharacterized protein n=1 Tax=Salipiger mucosus DSM 16094 TaxID=1123237 RepID=S9QDV7_9RHOB|nr:hypothetical protein [Salipiger mucosus]EPX78082.1 hypothetical protein Salmuc_03404 [Salipiger mucosus DSM 16094]
MPAPEINTVVPLYYLSKELGGPIVTVDEHATADGFEPVTSDTIVRQMDDGLGDLGGIDIWLMSTVEEAEAARAAFGGDAQSAKLRNGNGAVLKTRNASFEIRLEDRRRQERTAGMAEDRVFGSWTLDRGQMLTMQDLDEIAMEQATRGWAREVATMARHMGPAAVQQLQVDLETVPGAFVGFASCDIGTLREACDIAFENDAEAHSILSRCSQKYENATMMDDIEGYVLERLEPVICDKNEPEGPAGP